MLQASELQFARKQLFWGFFAFSLSLEEVSYQEPRLFQSFSETVGIGSLSR